MGTMRKFIRNILIELGLLKAKAAPSTDKPARVADNLNSPRRQRKPFSPPPPRNDKASNM